jgi:hypothetical protein
VGKSFFSSPQRPRRLGLTFPPIRKVPVAPSSGQEAQSSLPFNAERKNGGAVHDMMLNEPPLPIMILSTAPRMIYVIVPFIEIIDFGGPPLWSSGQRSWLQIQSSPVRFPALPDFLRSSESGTGSTQPHEYN